MSQTPLPELPADLWQREEPLRRAGELIEQSNGRIRAVSFDFFDTIVWRVVAKPTDVFKEVARRLHEKKLLRTEISPDEYEVLRRVAEIKTRERQNARDATCEDISIKDIYGNLQALVKDAPQAASIEHAVECDLCILNPAMASFIRHIVARGVKVMVVSDIYFSAEQLKDILRANQFDPSLFELVVTSADAGVCKGTGNLFKRVLKTVHLDANQIIHLGDNFHADVIGARKAGVRGCHYTQSSAQTRNILERERFLLGGQEPHFNGNSLRLLTARFSEGETDEASFGRMGALILGPVLTRFASWACDQYVAAGVKKVGALMREGELFGELLRRETAARGHDLEITPLYVNRKATDLAAIGRLTADNLIKWLEARPTLPVKTILSHFGLKGDVIRNLPFPLDEKIDKPEKIIRLAKFLFIPEIAGCIEEKSAEERRKIIDYLKPWLEGGISFGVCDIGYSASAQTQLKRILDLEGIKTPMVGCYLVNYERAAEHVLDGVDIRGFLGAYGHPYFYFRTFLRGPAFLEQSITAACGTTLGYERLSDGSVKPILDKMPYDDRMLRRQSAFKSGVLEFQKLWNWVSKLRPGLLDGTTEFSRRVLAEMDRAFAPILSRASSFPTTAEAEQFGSLALDDYYFDDSYKPLCGAHDRETFRKNGFASILGAPGVHWPHGVLHMENPRSASEFFSFGRLMLHCDTIRDDDFSGQPEITILLSAGRSAASLKECLTRLKNVSNRNLRYEVFLLTTADSKDIPAVAQEFARDIARFRVLERTPKQSPVELINLAADNSTAPLLMFLDEGTLLPDGWDANLLPAIRAANDIGMVMPRIVRRPNVEDPLAATLRGVVVRRSAFIESLGFNDELAPVGAAWQLALQMRESNWKIEFCSHATVETKFAETAISLASFEKALLKKRFPEFTQFADELSAKVISSEASNTPIQRTDSAPCKVDWIGSFLDAGSLSHVNRELTKALSASGTIKFNRVNTGVENSPAFKSLASVLSKGVSSDAAVTVRHAWPPDWTRPKNGKLVVVQPWEFGSLPQQWVKDLLTVDEAWVPSEYVRRVYVDSGVAASKVFVVPNGVDTEKFNPQAAPLQLPTTKKFKFLFVGGTIFRKGPDVLLKAYLENFTAAHDVCLVIKDFGGKTVYAGQTFEAKIRSAQAMPNAPKILYLNDEFPPESLPGLYTACDCLVLPYRGEGYGLPVVEAMASGLPVMVTADGATDDFVRDEFGFRIPAERTIFGDEISGMKLVNSGWLLEPNAAVLGERMKWIATHPEEARQRGDLARKHATQFCSWNQAAEIARKRIEALTGTRTEVRAPAKRAAIVLPACALAGHLGEANDLVRQKKFRAAWESTMAALAKRPFHPEAYLLLAEIAAAVGDGQDAKLCADYARHLAPELKSVKKFLNQRLKGNNRPEWLKLPGEVQSPASSVHSRLSVCLIVKNEERFIAQCLKSVREVAQQIVIVDTGSTDRTVEIAKEFGAEVHSLTWCDDFSAARNAALEHVTGDWVLALDADEELSPKDHAKLHAAMSDAATMAWRLPIIDVGRELDGCSYVPRLFRNAPGLFYLGRVHEQIFSSIEVRRAEWGLENKIGEAALIHHGYTKEVVRDRNKVERNLRLLEKAVEELPDEPHLLMNLGLELSRSGREAESFARYQEAFESLSTKPAEEVVPELRESLLTQYCSRLVAAQRYEEIVRVLTSPLAKATRNLQHPVSGLTASLHFSLGLAHFELKQFREAADQMRQCLAKRGERSLSPINRDILTAAPHHCLALSLANAGEAAEAEKAFEAGLKELDHVDSLRLDYAKFLTTQKRAVDALHQLNEIVTHDVRNIAAWRLGGQIALGQPEFLEFARDWTGEAARHVPEDLIVIAQRAEALMLSENIAAARTLWEKIWRSEGQPQALAALILCDAVAGEMIHRPDDTKDEIAASRAFIEWYRKLFAARAQKTLTRLMEQMNTLNDALPSAAKTLGAAMAEANREMVGA
ncbi:MAG TPA: glycosyltransferase [Verrucomicrobiae bacterium]|jgi:glycosyltransferase involved in cell wall biosynthesis/predicted HAD superfamily hydrolase|nr:glycosyltransferase [Verrucomicrobiae bacterium]